MLLLLLSIFLLFMQSLINNVLLQRTAVVVIVVVEIVVDIFVVCRQCHTSYTTIYEAQQEEDCEENYRKSCYIDYEDTAFNQTVQVQYSTVQFSTVQYSILQYSILQYSILQYCLQPDDRTVTVHYRYSTTFNQTLQVKYSEVQIQSSLQSDSTEKSISDALNTIKTQKKVFYFLLCLKK